MSEQCEVCKEGMMTESQSDLHWQRYHKPDPLASIADSLAKLANPIITLNAEPSPLDQLAQAMLKIINGDTRMFVDATRFHENGCYEISFTEKAGE